METNIQEIGKIIKEKEQVILNIKYKVHFLTPMVTNMKENGKMIQEKVKDI